tara:strand:- start:163 stop:369 length:207 start_codon:yes stop_codon:yes gene_type:complete
MRDMWFYCPNFKASIGYGESPYLNPKKQDSMFVPACGDGITMSVRPYSNIHPFLVRSCSRGSGVSDSQ